MIDTFFFPSWSCRGRRRPAGDVGLGSLKCVGPLRYVSVFASIAILIFTGGLGLSLLAGRPGQVGRTLGSWETLGCYSTGDRQLVGGSPIKRRDDILEHSGPGVCRDETGWRGQAGNSVVHPG